MAPRSNRIKGKGIGASSISLSVKGRYRILNPTTVRNTVRSKPSLKQAYGSVDGKLVLLSSNTKYTIRIVNETQGFSVTGTISESQLSLAKDGFGKRVSAHGKITYNPEGVPTKLVVQELRILKQRNELPGIYDVLGILNSE